MSAPISPSEAVRQHLVRKSWIQAQLADVLARPQQYVSELLKGRTEITRESACQLAAAFDTTPEYWLDLQNAYKLWHLQQDAALQRKLEGIRQRAKEDTW